jgi:hypothetical protein
VVLASVAAIVRRATRSGEDVTADGAAPA